jgi:hypothetical protein
MCAPIEMIAPLSGVEIVPVPVEHCSPIVYALHMPCNTHSMVPLSPLRRPFYNAFTTTIKTAHTFGSHWAAGMENLTLTGIDSAVPTPSDRPPESVRSSAWAVNEWGPGFTANRVEAWTRMALPGGSKRKVAG